MKHDSPNDEAYTMTKKAKEKRTIVLRIARTKVSNVIAIINKTILQQT
jgi:hypothetical protein